MGIGRKNMYVSDKDKLVTAYHEGNKNPHYINNLYQEVTL